MASSRFQKTPLHFLQYLALKFLCQILLLLPYKMSISLSKTLLGWARFILYKRFKMMQHNIQRAFPEKSSEEIKEIALESWCNMGTILAEFLHLSHMENDEFKKHCRIDGVKKLLQADKNTGGIIHIGHFTNWEAFGLASSVYGFEKAVLAQRVDNPYVDEEVNRLRNHISGHTF